MDYITLHFTRRPWNPISFAIRWAMPRTRFALALSSHAIVQIGDWCYEATMLHGVRKVSAKVALKGQLLVRSVHYEVVDLTAATKFADDQVGAGYDFQGAFGLPMAPDRNWEDPSSWFCYELAAAILRAAGRPVGVHLSHVGETALLSISPQLNAA